jgi:hypothetical protein
MPSMFVIFLVADYKPIDYETKQREKNKTKRKKAVVVFMNDDNPTLSLHCSDTDH